MAAGTDSVAVDVEIASSDPGIPATDRIERWVRAALAAAPRARTRALEVSVRIVDESESRRLNRDYRGKDGPTNVLSFPAGVIDGLPPDEAAVLGDIVVCAPVVRAEAERQAKPLPDHWAHMLVHGVLHLAGFDHVTDEEATVMERLETTILEALGVPDPHGAAPNPN